MGVSLHIDCASASSYSPPQAARHMSQAAFTFPAAAAEAKAATAAAVALQQKHFSSGHSEHSSTSWTTSIELPIMTVIISRAHRPNQTCMWHWPRIDFEMGGTASALAIPKTHIPIM